MTHIHNKQANVVYRLLAVVVVLGTAGCMPSPEKRCSEMLRGQLLDRESLRVNRFYQVNSEPFQRPGYDTYRMHYQAKNTFGGYVAEQRWLCRLPKY